MKIAFLASPKPKPQKIAEALIGIYGQTGIAAADYIVAIGGDGTVLKALHAGLRAGGKPVFAMRSEGSTGFLANHMDMRSLTERLRRAQPIIVHPLQAEVELMKSTVETVHAFNEVVIIRDRLQAAKLRIAAGEMKRSADLTGDGILVATPLGSTGYNLSAGGSALPYGSPSLALTGLAIHRGSDWYNRVLGDGSVIDIENLVPDHRPVRLETSERILTGVRRVRIECNRDMPATLLFDPE